MSRPPPGNVVPLRVDPETISFVRTVAAAGLALINAGTDKTQAEWAIRTIIEACNEELVRLGIEDA